MSKKKITKKIVKIQEKFTYNNPKRIGQKAKIVGNGHFLAFEFEDGTKEFATKSIICSRQRENSKKPIKTLCDFYNTNNDDNDPIYSYDKVYAIDTNTKFIENNYISVGVAVEIDKTQLLQNKITHDLKLKVSYVNFFYSKNAMYPDKIENYNWISLFELLKSKENKIAIVIDSDYDNICKYNERSLLINNCISLPANFHLIYASADSKATWANQMISICDKKAKNIIEDIKNKIEQPYFRNGTIEFSTGIKVLF